MSQNSAASFCGRCQRDSVFAFFGVSFLEWLVSLENLMLYGVERALNMKRVLLGTL